MPTGKSSSNVPRRLTPEKKAEMELEKLFEQLNIQRGEIKVPSRKEPGENGYICNVDTNVYQIKTYGGLFVYCYDIDLTGKTLDDYYIDLTKKGYCSVTAADLTNKCRRAFQAIFDQNKEFFGNKIDELCYDLQSTLYTLRPLNIPFEYSSVLFALERESLKIPFLDNFERISMRIGNVKDIELDDLFSIISKYTLEYDPSILKCIEAFVNQYSMQRPENFLTLHSSTPFFRNGQSFNIPEEFLDTGETKYLAAGIQKSATLIKGFEPPDGSADPNQQRLGLIVQTKHVPFHSSIPLLDYIQRHRYLSNFYPKFLSGELTDTELRRFERVFQNMHFDAVYPDGRRVQIQFRGVDQHTANNNKIDGSEKTIATYFAEHHKKLEHPDAHLIWAFKTSDFYRRNIDYYPPEILYIAANQIITAKQMDFATKERMIYECAIRPDRMEEENNLAVQAIQLHFSEHSINAGIRFSRNPLSVKSRALTPPTIYYANNNSIDICEDRACWKMREFVKPGSCQNYAIYMIRSETNEEGIMTPHQFNALVLAIGECATRMGIELGELKDTGIYNDHQVEERIKYCSENDIQFVMFVTPEYIKTAHKVMKMCESRYNVVTQDMTMKTAFKIIQGNANDILKNYIAKTNVKLGGLNHSIVSEDPEIMNELKSTLFVSISTNQSKGLISCKNPALVVLGYSGNYASNYNEFLGDFCYAPSLQLELYPEFRKIFKLCVERFKESRGYSPKSIVFYYDGEVLEDQLKSFYDYSVPLIKKGISEGNDDVPIPLTILSVQKASKTRLFPTQYPQAGQDVDFNVPHGTVVDNTVVSPVFNEFYLAPHSVKKGTARIPRYTIIFDENEYSMDLLEGLTHVLSYEHQIVGKATSVPTPIYVAEQYAQRGRVIFISKLKSDEPELPKKSDGSYNMEQMSEMLNYSGTSLWNKRVNA